MSAVQKTAPGGDSIISFQETIRHKRAWSSWRQRPPAVYPYKYSLATYPLLSLRGQSAIKLQRKPRKILRGQCVIQIHRKPRKKARIKVKWLPWWCCTILTYPKNPRRLPQRCHTYASYLEIFQLSY